MYRCLFILLFYGCTSLLTAQEVFYLTNPSFEEGDYGAGRTPQGWVNIGAKEESPPDIQPGAFGVTLAAKHGKQYISMVTRDNGTWEGLAQRLDGWLKKDSAYMFAVWLAQSKHFSSVSRNSNKEQNYDGPTVLNIIGYNTKTKQEQLLGQSDVISIRRWQQYTFTLYPTTADFDEIDLVAYYADDTNKSRGHLLLDNCSIIRQIPNTTFPKYGDKPPVTKSLTEISTESAAPKSTPNAQKTVANIIELQNSSFEKDRRGENKTPFDWLYLGSCKTCRPTIEPGASSRKRPDNGKTFISLSVYEDGEVESIGQRLPVYLLQGQEYDFSVKLAHDNRFAAVAQNGATMPLKGIVTLRILGYNIDTNKKEMLAQTIPIDHSFWYQYDFRLTPQLGDYNMIVLEAQYATLYGNKSYNGHVLIDNCSDIIRR